LTKRRPPRIPNRPLSGGADDLPSLALLDTFSVSSIRQGLANQQALEQFQSELYFGLEQQRAQHSQELIDAVREGCSREFAFERWARIVDYRYSLAPLSIAGSLKSDGGRFNIGNGLKPGSFPGFPALYVAEDYDTAFQERYGIAHGKRIDGLSPDELVLRWPDSFTHVSLCGRLELVIDVGNSKALAPLVEVLKRFSFPPKALTLARRLNLKPPPSLLRSTSLMQRHLLHPHWRTMPSQFDLPSNSQIFGRIAAAAGVHGILYPSARASAKRCLALFPQNWSGSSSFVAVMDGAPSTARLLRLDGTSHTFQ
jgi:RES domain-containing protein